MLGEGGSNQLIETLVDNEVRCMLRIDFVAYGDERVVGVFDRVYLRGGERMKTSMTLGLGEDRSKGNEDNDFILRYFSWKNEYRSLSGMWGQGIGFF